MNNYLWPYLMIMLHFVSGAIWIFLINRNLDQISARNQWTKYFTYLLIFNLVWYSIIWYPSALVVLGSIIILTCGWEWWIAISKTQGRIWLLAGFMAAAIGFWSFLHMAASDILFAFFLVMLFDGASQIAGQLLGKHSLLPKISPNKTIEGLIGGTLITLGSALLVKHSFSMEWNEVILKGLMVITFALAGDLMASFVKRRANLVTFGRLLPGHGGFLDRFDSLIMAGSLTSLLGFLNVLW